MKKLYLLLLILCISFVPVSAQDIKVTYTDAQGTWEFTILTHRDEETGQDVPYAARLDKATDYGDDITIPSVVPYQGTDYSLEIIGNSVFSENKILTRVFLPTTVKRIESDTFHNCSGLKEVKNTNNCEYIGWESFEGCSSLTIVDLSSCKELADYAFAGCGQLQDVVSLAKVQKIGHNAFDGCVSLSTIVVSEELEIMDYCAFDGCRSLININLPAGIEIGWEAFDECINLVNIGTLDNSDIGARAFRNCESLKSIDLSKSKIINEKAFENCTSLESVGDLSALTSLNNSVFANCKSLKEVNLSSCKTINSSAFENCFSLSKVIMGECTMIENDAFKGCAFQSINLSTVKLLGDRVFYNCINFEDVGSIPSLKKIGGESFSGCQSLKNIDISKVERFGNNAFQGCNSLTEIDLSSCESLGVSVFNGCANLVKVDGFTHITEIPDGLFNGCQSLETIDLSKVETIGNDVFSGCKSLKSVDLPLCKTLGNNVFMNCESLETIDLSKVENIGNEAFASCNSIKNIDIPLCKTLGYGVFLNCQSLETVNLPLITSIPHDNTSRWSDNLYTLRGRGLFEGCKALKKVTMPLCESIGSYAFYGCASLESIDFPLCVVIGNEVFRNCSSLKTVNLPLLISLPDGVNSMYGWWYDENNNRQERARGLFEGCISLEKIKISSCTTIGSYAFNNCSSLDSITLSKVEVIGENAFRGCIGLVSVDSLKVCESIGASAFQDCSSLNKIDLSKIGKIDNNAFSNCSGLTTIDLTACQTLGSNVFSGCTNLVKVEGFGHFTVIPDGMFRGLKFLESVDLSKIESIGNSAFEGCSSLTTIDLTACSSLGTNVFSGCSNLKTIKGFTNITEIPDGLFNGLEALETIDLSKIEKIGNNALKNCIGLTTLNLNSCKSVGSEAFMGCKRLKNLEFPACESLGRSAFMNCDSLATISFPILTSLPDGYYENDRTWSEEYYRGLFFGCKSLFEVKIPLCKTIGKGAFANCSELSSIGTLAKCDSIGDNAFSGCNKLGDFIIESTTLKYIGSNVFTHTGNITFMTTTPAAISGNTFGEYILCLVPAEALETYQTADKWYDIRNRIFTIGDKFDYDIEVTAQESGSGIYTAMGEDNLRKAVSLKLTGTINSYDIMIMRDKMPNLHYLDMSETSVLENSYEYYTGYSTSNDALSTNSFSGLGKIVTVKLPKTLKYLGDAFRECKNLRSIEMYDSLNTIGGWAFYECENLNNIVLPKNLKTISDHGFARCYSLQKIVMPEGLTRLDSRAFEYCSSLTDVTFPSTLETIGGEVFYECSALNNVVFPSNSKLTVIEGGAFERCYSLPGIKLPNRLSIIGKEAFESCHNLKELNIPSSVTEIQDEAFYGCGIRKVYTYTVLPTKINQNTFSNYENAVLYIPDFSDSRNNYYFSTGWSQFSKLEPFDKNIDYDYFYLNEDYTLDEDRIEGDPDADVNPGGGLIVEGDDTQNLSDVTISNNNNGIWGAIIGNSNISANLLKFEIQVQGNKWYFFSFPYDIKMSNIDCQSQFLFRYYDGEARAENGSGGWKDLIKGSDVLERGKGYIFQCSQNSILKITIETPTFDAEDFKQALSDYASGNAQDAGWNFVGNPYTSYFDLNDTKYSAPITVWNENTRSYEALRPGDDDYNFHPFQAFFVQKPEDTGEINFDSKCRATYTKSEEKQNISKARRLSRGIDAERQLINLTIADSEVRDKTRVVFNDAASVDYEIGCDAAKFISTENVPQIYSVDNEGNKYAINERPSGEVKIAYQVNSAGTYKIGLTRMDRAVVLYDDEIKAEFDFSTGDYSFDTEAGTYENRFVLKIANGSATGLADIKKETGVSAMGCDEGIYVNNVGTSQVDIYSMSGVLLATHLCDGLVRLPKATYIIKVNNLSTKVLVK